MNDRQRLEAIIEVLGRYLPPDGPLTEHEAMNEIIGLVDPLPPAIPQFVAGEIGKRVFDRAYGLQSECGEDTSAHEESNAWLTAWRAELGPALGLVEIREPTPEECIAINEHVLRAHGIEGCGAVLNGRVIFDAVAKWLKGEL